MKLFVPVLATLFFVIHLLFYRRVVKRLHLPGRTDRALAWAVWGNFLGVLGYLTARYGLQIPQPLYYLFSLSVGIGFLLFLGWLLYEILFLIHRLPWFRGRHEGVKKAVDALFVTTAAGVVAAAVYGGAQAPAIREISVDQGLFNKEGYRIVQISDMHVGGLVGRDFVEECVAHINALHPNLVVITGDLTDMRIDRIADALRPLAGLRSRLGVFYVPGNHEYFHGIDATLAYLPHLGITVLKNRALKLDGRFWIVGVDDLMGRRMGRHAPDVEAAYRAVTDDAPVLLLAHQPKFLKELAGHRFDLMLSGHTHGGQVWPFGYLVGLVQPYVKGLHQTPSQGYIYVNSGIGFWGPPMRLDSRAEIAVIEWK